MRRSSAPFALDNRIDFAGSSDGIGQAIAHELCSKGLNIILHGRNPTKLSKVQSNLLASFPKTQFRSFVADAGASTEITTVAIRDLVASIKDPNLTALVNNDRRNWKYGRRLYDVRGTHDKGD